MGNLIYPLTPYHSIMYYEALTDEKLKDMKFHRWLFYCSLFHSMAYGAWMNTSDLITAYFVRYLVSKVLDYNFVLDGYCFLL